MDIWVEHYFELSPVKILSPRKHHTLWRIYQLRNNETKTPHWRSSTKP